MKPDNERTRSMTTNGSLRNDRPLIDLARRVLADKGTPPLLLLAAWAYLYPRPDDDPRPGCSFPEMVAEAAL